MMARLSRPKTRRRPFLNKLGVAKRHGTMHGERNQPGLKTRVKKARRTAGDSGPSPIGNGTLELPAMAALDAAFDEYRRVDAATVQSDDCRSSHYDTAGNKSVHALRGM